MLRYVIKLLPICVGDILVSKITACLSFRFSAKTVDQYNKKGE